jgi:hypothetical protein
VFDEQNREIPFKTDPPSLSGHQQNFIDAIRGNGALNAEIEVGHLSASLCHLGNIATRTGRTLRFDPQQERVVGEDEAQLLIGRKYRWGGHWAIPQNDS